MSEKMKKKRKETNKMGENLDKIKATLTEQ